MRETSIACLIFLMSAGQALAAEIDSLSRASSQETVNAPAAPAVPGTTSRFLYGDESKGVSVGTDGADMNIRIRIVPRFEYGTLFTAPDGKTYAQGNDIYFRRARLEMSGTLVSKSINYNLTFSADKWDQAGGTTPTVKLYNSYLVWDAAEYFSVRLGKAKLPYSRISIIPDQTLLLIEYPCSTDAATKLFGGTDPYYQPHLLIKGRVLGGVLSYELAAGDGWHRGETIYKKGDYSTVDTAETKVAKGGALTVARIELSPPGWVEKKKNDAPLGLGKHLTLGADYVAQKGIAFYNNTANLNIKEDRVLTGYDLSGHYKGLTMMYEYNTWSIRQTAGTKKDVAPRGWFVQAGYLIQALNLNIEPSARYEVFNQNSNKSDARERIVTAGLNWYLKGHGLKMGANWLNTRYEKNAKGHLSNEDKKDIFLVQTQLYF